MPDRHVPIIIGAINALQGEVTGAGTLESLKGYMPTVDALEDIENNPEAELTEAQQAVLDKSHDIADSFGNGFTPGGLASDTGTLGTLIGNL